jgi:hypothetical protein
MQSRAAFLTLLALIGFLATPVHGAQKPHATIAKEGDPIAGKWKWAENITVDIFPDGKVNAHFPTFNVDGQWTAGAQEAKERHYTIRWQGGQYVDTITLDEAAKHLFGQNNVGWKIFAERIGAAPATTGQTEAPAPLPPPPPTIPQPAPPQPAASLPAAPPPPPATPAPVPPAPPQTVSTTPATAPGGADPAKAPWLQPDAAEKYVFVGKNVWDTETGKQVPGATLPTPVLDHSRAVLGAPGVFYQEFSNHGVPALDTVGSIYKFDGTYPRTPTAIGTGTGNAGTFPGFWTDLQRRRVLWIEHGDFWRGDLDWAEVKIANRKQVTKLGSFQFANRPELWWEHMLYVWGGFDQQKPIVRINLATGAVDEMETDHVFGPDPHGDGSFLSPNSCRICRITPGIIYSYDARTGKATEFSNKLEGIAGMGATTPRLLTRTDPAAWEGDDVVYFVTPDAIVAKLDFRNSRMQVMSPAMLDSVDGRSAAREVVVKGFVPGGHYVEIVTKKGMNAPPEAAGGTKINDRFLIDVTNGQRIALPMTADDLVIWIDENRCLYIRHTGGLSSTGTRLFDLRTKTDTRLSGTEITLFGTDQRSSGNVPGLFGIALLKHRNEIWGLAQQGGSSLLRLRLGGGTSENLGAVENLIPSQLPSGDPIDLGLQPGAHADLWKVASVDLASLAPTLPKEAPQGKLRLIQETKSFSPEEFKFAENTYEFALQEKVPHEVFDPVKFTLVVCAAHKANPSRYDMRKVNLKEAFNRETALKFASYWAMHSNNGNYVFEARNATHEQLVEVAKRTSETFVETFSKSPTACLFDIDPMLNKILLDTFHSLYPKKGPKR